MRKIIVISWILLLIPFYLFAQNPWLEGGNAVISTQTIGTSSNYDFPIVTNGTEKARVLKTGEIGLGTASPSSWLHVISNGNQETFRTDVNSSIDNYWRMYRNGTEYARLYHLSAGSAFYIHAPRGNLRLGSGNGGTNIPAFQMQGGSGSNAGYVGVGDYTTFNPASLFHIHRNTASTKADFQMTNASTGTTSADGFLVDVSHTSPDINFRQQENNSMIFYTGSAGGTVYERMRINGDATNGNIGIGLSTPPIYTRLGIDAIDVPSTASFANATAIAINSIQTNPSSVASNNGIEALIDGGATQTGLSLRLFNGTGSVYGIKTECLGTGNCIAGEFSANGFATSENRGLFCHAANCSDINTGAYIEGLTGVAAYGLRAIAGEATDRNYAIIAEAMFQLGTDPLALNCGVYSESVRTNTGSNIGVYGKANNGSISYGIVGIGGSPCTTPGCALAAGYFDGDVFCVGNVNWTSDLKLKKNITPFNNGLQLISQLEPKTFEFDTAQFPQMNLSHGMQYGFIAQDLELILPELVKFGVNPPELDSIGTVTAPAVDYKSINYIQIIPIIVQALKETNSRIDSIIATLNSTSRPASSPVTEPTAKGQKVILKDIQTVILNQSEPNPFTESTRITYIIPEDVHSAKIVFTNSSGAVINSVVITDRGFSELQVFSGELGTGIYTYTLVCDGKIIDSKKMMKQ